MKLPKPFIVLLKQQFSTFWVDVDALFGPFAVACFFDAVFMVAVFYALSMYYDPVGYTVPHRSGDESTGGFRAASVWPIGVFFLLVSLMSLMCTNIAMQRATKKNQIQSSAHTFSGFLCGPLTWILAGVVAVKSIVRVVKATQATKNEGGSIVVLESYANIVAHQYDGLLVRIKHRQDKTCEALAALDLAIVTNTTAARIKSMLEGQAKELNTWNETAVKERDIALAGFAKNRDEVFKIRQLQELLNAAEQAKLNDDLLFDLRTQYQLTGRLIDSSIESFEALSNQVESRTKAIAEVAAARVEVSK